MSRESRRDVPGRRRIRIEHPGRKVENRLRATDPNANREPAAVEFGGGKRWRKRKREEGG